MIGLVVKVYLVQAFLVQVFGQALGQARDVVPGWALVATGILLGLASVVVRAMQAMECPLAWKQEVGIGVAAVVEAQMGSSLEELMGCLLGVTSGQWMLMDAYPPAVGLRGWIASALAAVVQRNGRGGFRLLLQMTDSWPGLLCSTEKGLEEELMEELEEELMEELANGVVGAMAWPR